MPAAKKQENHDEADIERALRKTDTADGPGFDSEAELPDSDFEGFAEGDVEMSEEDPK